MKLKATGIDVPVELVLGGEMPEVKLGEPATVVIASAEKEECFQSNSSMR